jgi:hypothetical protein
MYDILEKSPYVIGQLKTTAESRHVISFVTEFSEELDFQNAHSIT